MFFKFLSSRCSCSRSAAARRACNSPAGPGMRMCVCVCLALSRALSLVLNDLLFVRPTKKAKEGKVKSVLVSVEFLLLLFVSKKCFFAALPLSTMVTNVFLSCFYCYSLISFSLSSSSSSSLPPQDFPRRRSFPLRLRCPRIGRFGRWRC